MNIKCKEYMTKRIEFLLENELFCELTSNETKEDLKEAICLIDVGKPLPCQRCEEYPDIEGDEETDYRVICINGSDCCNTGHYPHKSRAIEDWNRLNGGAE